MFLSMGNLITTAILTTASLHPQSLMAGSFSAQKRPSMPSPMPDARHYPPTSQGVTLRLPSLPSTRVQGGPGEQCQLSYSLPGSLSPFQQLHSFTQSQEAQSCLGGSFLWGRDKVAPPVLLWQWESCGQIPLCEPEIPVLSDP